MLESNIFIKGAKVNNLKNIDIKIPHNKLITISGLSGSGKSSLAFGTLYAEGQSRYIETMAPYIRQFLGKKNKPKVDFIKRLPPTIAVVQKTNNYNLRSTVATSTKIYNYMCVLFSKIGNIISPISGNVVRKHNINDLLNEMSRYPNGTRVVLLSKIISTSSVKLRVKLNDLMHEGFSRVEINNEIYNIRELLESNKILNNVYLLIDRAITGNHEAISHFSNSIETAFLKGDGSCILRFYTEQSIISKEFSQRFKSDGIEFEEPSELIFNFNNQIGACPFCGGLGIILRLSEKLIIPDPTLSVYDDAVACWKDHKMNKWKQDFIKKSFQYNFPINCPYHKLTQKEKKILWLGNETLYGIETFFKYVEKKSHKARYKIIHIRYTEKSICPKCKGRRLKPQALYVKVGNKSISDLMVMNIAEVNLFLKNLKLINCDTQIIKRLLIEIMVRLQFLIDVGLGYLTLGKSSSTLSSGENSRINLVVALVNNLVGVLYILDEPSIGLHCKDVTLLIKVLKKLQIFGNTVILVENDETFIRLSDYIVDIGPKAGIYGGKITYQGEVAKLDMCSNSYTIRYLTKQEVIEIPLHRRKCNNFICIKNVHRNNLKGFDAYFPLNLITVVTGVSGSGKSSLVRDELYKKVKKYCDSGEKDENVLGDLYSVKHVKFIDQSHVRISKRSNLVTYTKAFDEIRKLFAEQPLSKQLCFTSSSFSLNVEGGRCKECKGEGLIKVKMQFMPDVVLECEFCRGKKFSENILNVKYHNKNIYDILNMTVDEAFFFFKKQEYNTIVDKIICRLEPLREVGLGYIELGQSSDTFSRGENQRLKLACYIFDKKLKSTLFIFDEPTVGLHFYDIKKLIYIFNVLIAHGSTVIIIEHNMDIIKIADHIIDLGPDGGENGGNLIAVGTPEEIIKNSNSVTGKFLKVKLKENDGFD
jgi:excinuclease ABC subunit A